MNCYRFHLFGNIHGTNDVVFHCIYFVTDYRFYRTSGWYIDEERRLFSCLSVCLSAFEHLQYSIFFFENLIWYGRQTSLSCVHLLFKHLSKIFSNCSTICTFIMHLKNVAIFPCHEPFSIRSLWSPYLSYFFNHKIIPSFMTSVFYSVCITLLVIPLLYCYRFTCSVNSITCITFNIILNIVFLWFTNPLISTYDIVRQIINWYEFIISENI